MFFESYLTAMQVGRIVKIANMCETLYRAGLMADENESMYPNVESAK